MSLNGLDISEFLNKYKSKLKEEKERLELHFQSKDNVHNYIISKTYTKIYFDIDLKK